MKATFEHLTLAPTELINDNTVTLTNHIRSISCHIIPLVITSLGGRDTQTRIATICTGSSLGKQVIKIWYRNYVEHKSIAEVTF